MFTIFLMIVVPICVVVFGGIWAIDHIKPVNTWWYTHVEKPHDVYEDGWMV